MFRCLNNRIIVWICFNQAHIFVCKMRMILCRLRPLYLDGTIEHRQKKELSSPCLQGRTSSNIVLDVYWRSASSFKASGYSDHHHHHRAPLTRPSVFSLSLSRHSLSVNKKKIDLMKRTDVRSFFLLYSFIQCFSISLVNPADF